jgi:hypothetical protein
MAISQIWTSDFFEAKRKIADPDADAAIEAMVEEKGTEEARHLFDLLTRNIDMPVDQFSDSILNFLNTHQQLPDWADQEKIRAGHLLFRDHGPKCLIFLYYKSLPLLYSCAKGAEVLVHTSRLTNSEEGLKIFTRRIAETGQFLLNVMTEDGLQPGGIGLQTIQKVRLIHASIRFFLRQKDWDTSAFDEPINQEDLAITLMTFSIALIDALRQFNIDVPIEQAEGYLHTWSCIGSLLGIDEDLLPQNEIQARFLLNTILERQSGRSDAGILLTQALLSFAERTIPRERFDRLPPILMRFLIGEERAQMLGITPENGCISWLIPKAFQSYFNLSERLEDKVSEPLQIFLDKLSRSTASAMVGYFDNYKQQYFQIPKEFKSIWLPNL